MQSKIKTGAGLNNGNSNKMSPRKLGNEFKNKFKNIITKTKRCMQKLKPKCKKAAIEIAIAAAIELVDNSVIKLPRIIPIPKTGGSYYNCPADPLLDLSSFKEKAPLFVIDCSRQNDSLKTGPVDVRLEIECTTAIPEKTTGYCLIINDQLVEYKPLSNIVRKLT
ncbi:unnamed protein product [Parnassius mnemosyne]|uniref:Double jelly roll-like domain-containing protein n=1 Tax=Parnassius mnemosyne TaxID=213953 RepID=A0AAV1KGM6_9NEOP